MAWGANLGGVSSSTRSRMLGLRALGVHCEILFRQAGAGMDTHNGFPLHITADPGEFQHLVTSGGYDVVSLINSDRFLSDLVRMGYPGAVLLEVRGMARIALRACARLSPGTVAGIIVPSRYVQGLVTAALKGKPFPVRVVPNAVDVSLFRPGPATAPARPVLLWVGRLDANKNWPELLTILRLLLDRGEDVEAWVAGDTNVAGQVGEFRERVARRDLGDRVKLLPCVPHHSMPALYQETARSGGCVLSTSRSEGYQNSLLEGMACGCPVVSSAVGGNRELVDGSTGLLYPVGRPLQAAGQIIRLLRDAGLRRQLIDNGLARVSEHHTPVRHAEAFLEALSDLPAVPPSPAGRVPRSLRRSRRRLPRSHRRSGRRRRR